MTDCKVKVAGEWKQAEQIYTKVNGEWKECWKKIVQHKATNYTFFSIPISNYAGGSSATIKNLKLTLYENSTGKVIEEKNLGNYTVVLNTSHGITIGEGENWGTFTPIVAALVGLIPNCASSVVLTELFLGGVISTGAVIAGLIANSGVGMLILFRVNKNVRANLSVMLTVFLSGALIGVLFDLVGIVL